MWRLSPASLISQLEEFLPVELHLLRPRQKLKWLERLELRPPRLRRRQPDLRDPPGFHLGGFSPLIPPVRDP